MLKKLNNKKGFTLMEMLIVVAIIAILVAIAIPSMNASLNKARVATDEANIRAEYAEAMVDYLDKNTAQTKTVTTTGKNTNADLKIAGVTVGTWDKGATVTIEIDADGQTTIKTK